MSADFNFMGESNAEVIAQRIVDAAKEDSLIVIMNFTQENIEIFEGNDQGEPLEVKLAELGVAIAVLLENFEQVISGEIGSLNNGNGEVIE